MNKQKPQPVVDNPDALEVHSVFFSIQGEGPFSGRPAHFVRLAGCNLRCPQCDTDYTDVSVGMTPQKIWKLMVARKKPDWGDLVVITGGEPFRQNITALVYFLSNIGMRIQIETNGTLPIPDDFPMRRVSIVCSPKTPELNIDEERISAFKYVIGSEMTLSKVSGFPFDALGVTDRASCGVAIPSDSFKKENIYFQPLDQQSDTLNNKNNLAAVSACLEHGYTFSVQLHKIVGLE